MFKFYFLKIFKIILLFLFLSKTAYAQGAAREGVGPLRGVNRVSLHADRTLRMEP